ncbi:MAG TPA: hypothetical protein VFG58_07880 [Solirubrobacterales bacterium]|nr:hypothetical protein [Solirubrobacterales bacterium]
MAVGLRIKMAGGTREMYEAIHAKMDVDANPPDGLIFHMAGPVDDGWGIIDAWESREQFDAFQADRLMGAIQSLGDQAPAGPPDIKEFPVHHYTKP